MCIRDRGKFGIILGEKKMKSRLPVPQFVPVQRMKPWETFHPLVVVKTTKLKVNIPPFHVEGIIRQIEKKSIVFGHNGKAKHNNALIVNIQIHSIKCSLKSTSSASFNAAANRLLFLIKTTLVKITQHTTQYWKTSRKC